MGTHHWNALHAWEATPRLLAAVFCAAALAGCASTTIRDTWSDPEVRNAPFRQILVLAVLDIPAERRTLEDIVSQRISATGSHGISAYPFLPESQNAEGSQIALAVRTSRADALLTIRLKGMELRTQVTPQFAIAPGFYYGGWGGWGWGMSGMWYGPPNVYQYSVATSEVSLTDVQTNKLLWSSTVETTDPRPIAKTGPEFADKIVAALQKKKYLPGGK